MTPRRPKVSVLEPRKTLSDEIVGIIEKDDADRLRTTIATRSLGRHPINNALWLSCESGSVQCTKVLLDEFRATVSFGGGANRKSALMVVNSSALAKALIDAVGAKKVAYLDHRDSNGRCALMHAILHDRHEVAHFLLDEGASPDTVDCQGRTTLMTAAWRNNISVLMKLLNQTADANVVDDRGRNLLHHFCEDEERAQRSQSDQPSEADKTILQLLLENNVETNKKEIFGGRTPLHFAAAYNNRHAARQLLDRSAGIDFINERDAEGETSLHISAALGHVELTDLLLERNANPAMANEMGSTPLHSAAGCKTDPVEIVKALLKSTPDREYNEYLNQRRDARRTALHDAAEANNADIVEYLLSQQNIDVGARDIFGSTAMLHAARLGHEDVVRHLTERNYATLSVEALEVSKRFFATIVDFAPDEPRNGPTKLSKPVFSLLSGAYPVYPEPDAKRNGYNFRWIHLPANNVGWAQELLIQCLDKGHDTLSAESFEALQMSFNHEHIGNKVHSHYMRPECNLIPVADTPLREEHHANSPSPSPVSQNRNQSASRDGRQRWEPGYSEDEVQNLDDLQLKIPQRRRQNAKRKARSRTAANSQGSISLSTLRTTKPSLTNSMYLFMPYLHYESSISFDNMQKAVMSARKAGPPGDGKEAGNPAAKRGNFIPASFGDDRPDRALLRSHLNRTHCSMHIRRTLDQFFYRTIDTSVRDGDQVVLRHQRDTCKKCRARIGSKFSLHESVPSEGDRSRRGNSIPCPHDAKLVMVDQLWMWVVGPELIITSFPQGWEQSDHNPDRLVERILRHIWAPTHARISDVYELALVIASQCTQAFNVQNSRGDGDLFLDMFESTIGGLMDKETKLFRTFEAASNEASRWLRNRRTIPDGASRYRVWTSNNAVLEDWEVAHESRYGSNDGSEPPFIQTLLDIQSETLLLREIKDVRDELEMLRMIFAHQRKVCQEAYSSVMSAIEDAAQEAKLEKQYIEHSRRINTPLSDIQRMQTQANNIYMSIKDLLDMKQKYAVSLQASDTARQGQTLMVFTIVTVVFLPLSFIAAFFAINIDSFPHNKSGSIEMPLSYVSEYVFGIGFAVTLPCVIIALTVNRIVLFIREKYCEVELWRMRRRRRGPQNIIGLWRELMTEKPQAAAVNANSTSNGQTHNHSKVSGTAALQTVAAGANGTNSAQSTIVHNTVQSGQSGQASARSRRSIFAMANLGRNQDPVVTTQGGSMA